MERAVCLMPVAEFGLELWRPRRDLSDSASLNAPRIEDTAMLAGDSGPFRGSNPIAPHLLWAVRRRGQTVQIPDDASRANRQLGFQSPGSVHALTAGIEKAEGALPQAEDCHVGFRAHGQIT